MSGLGFSQSDGKKVRHAIREHGHGKGRVCSPPGASHTLQHDEDLREPLVRRQGSQVSMRVARVTGLLAFAAAAAAAPAPQLILGGGPVAAGLARDA